MEWVCLVSVLAITEKFPPPHPHPAPTLVLTSGHQLRFYRVRLPIYHTQLKIQLKIAAMYFTKNVLFHILFLEILKRLQINF